MLAGEEQGPPIGGQSARGGDAQRRGGQCQVSEGAPCECIYNMSLSAICEMYLQYIIYVSALFVPLLDFDLRSYKLLCSPPCFTSTQAKGDPGRSVGSYVSVISCLTQAKGDPGRGSGGFRQHRWEACAEH